MIYILCLLLFSTTSIPEKTPPTWPSLTTPLPTPLASPLPYSRMIFEGICGTISELGLIKLSSEFSTLASPHATQLTSSEDYPKGVVSTLFGIFVADLVHELRAKFPHCGYSPWTPTAKPTSKTHIWIGGLLSTRIYNAHLDSTRIYNAHLNWRSNLC